MSSERGARRVVIESIDGSGKSTTGLAVAQRLSEEYPESKIKVADSNGVTTFENGEQTKARGRWIESLEPHGGSKITRLARLGMFTVARRMSESAASHEADLLIGIRDPYRVDPATYAIIFGPKKLRQMSAAGRLALFDKFTHAPDPQLIVRLNANCEQASQKALSRGDTDEHESLEKMQMVAHELPNVINEYSQAWGVPVQTVEALSPQTVDQVSMAIEPFAIRPGNSVFFPSQPQEAKAA